MPVEGQRRLAFGDDHSPMADAAWLWVMKHPWPGWRIEVITATQDDGQEGPALTEWDPPHHRDHPDPDVSVVHEVLRADPRQGLPGLTGYDLMVVGPRGGGLRKLFGFGSVSVALLHDPPGPLAVVRHADRTRRAAYLADGSPHALAALAALVSLPWIGEVDVQVLSVREAGVDAQAAAEAARSVLEGACASVEVRVLAPDPLEVFHRTEDMLLDEIATWGADLAVLGTRGMGAAKSLRAGSIARSLADHASCSVLLAKAD